MEQRITDLEIRISHQESSIDELTKTLLAQEDLIRKLIMQVKQLTDQVKEVSVMAHESEEVPPPHY